MWYSPGRVGGVRRGMVPPYVSGLPLPQPHPAARRFGRVESNDGLLQSMCELVNRYWPVVIGVNL